MCLWMVNLSAQQDIDLWKDIDLWQDGLPNSNGIDKTQPFDDATQNFKPSIRVFLPEKDKANGMAVVCCPGGAYSHLAMSHEGYDWAQFYNDLGIALIVLKYRMPHGVKEVPISDAMEAMRIVRKHAAEWNIDPGKVGIMGSSAGGHLATTIATHSDSTVAPAFQVLFYPVVSMQKGVTHQGSHDNLLGKNAAQSLNDSYSNATQVTPNTPPAIMLLSDDDKGVVPQNSVEYYQALKKAGVKASLHIYPSGGHGWGFKPGFKFHDRMTTDLKDWLCSLYPQTDNEKSTNRKMKIAVIVAMEKEMAHLVALLNDKKEEVKNGIKYVVGELNGKTIVVHQCGIGKVNAAIGTSELINNYHPDYLISSGCAGGIGDDLKVMDVIASDCTIYHDVILDDKTMELDIQKPYKSDKYLVDKACELSSDKSLPTIHIGKICTGDHFATNKDVVLGIKADFPDGLAIDMESCAIAQTCQFYGVPFISFRIISDTVNAEVELDEYKNFWATMADKSFHVIKAYIDSL